MMRFIGPAFRAHYVRMLVLCLALSLFPAAITGQQASGKRPLTHADYDTWRAIQLQQFSPDARLLGYALVPQDADGEAVVRNLSTGTEWRHPRGVRPAAAEQREPDDQRGPFPGRPGGAAATSQLAFTTDGKYLVFQIYPAKAEVEEARKQKKRPEEMPKSSMGIMDLANGEVVKIGNVRRFQVPEGQAGFIAYLLEPKPEERPAQEPKPEPAGAGSRQAGRRGPQGRTEYGSDLVLRNMTDKSERTFADVTEFSISKDAGTLFYAVSSRKPETNGVYRVTTGSAGSPTALLTGKGKYTRLTWDEKQTQLAFLSDRDEPDAKQPRVKLYRCDPQGPVAVELVSTATPGFRQGLVISDRGPLTFSQDGARLFFGVAPPPEPEVAEEAPPDEQKVVMDLWHWKDDLIQPMQKVRAEQERNRSYRAVFHIAEKRFVQLADSTMAEFNPSAEGLWGLGSDDRNYRMLVGYDATYSDYYLVNAADGSRKQILAKQSGSVTWSPAGRHALFFDGKDWNSISVPDGKIANLTKSLGVNFWQEDIDRPEPAGPYGNGGWTKDDRQVLLYDRYDIWQVSPEGTAARNLTDGLGRKEKTIFRYVRLDPEERAVDPQQPLLLRAESEETRDTGFYRDRIDGGAPQKIIMAAKNFTPPVKAKGADLYLFASSTFNEFPDLMVSGPDFAGMKKVTDANPQKAQLLWGASELIRFRNTDGVALKAILIKPENFDPRNKYPLMVYIYERLSEGLHRFVDPRPGHSINIAYYVSNGYVVLEPDIVYTVGYPGQSALKCVLPAVQEVVDLGFIDEKAIGIQGHSWGGYEIAYMVTQTDRFRAASPGALVSNMTSAYSGIRWGTGLPRQFQYEHTQSRIGGTLWEYPMRFLQNSPVFHADRVQTPIIMLANDEDDAVPWYQGIEYYLALRRLGKEVYMFNYNGEKHHLDRRPNQKDYTMRLQQFFDHYLKGAPMPEWMQEGIPYLDRDKEKERFGKPTP